MGRGAWQATLHVFALQMVMKKLGIVKVFVKLSLILLSPQIVIE